MNQAIYGVLIFIALCIPPVAHFLESIMIMHMHMQMTAIVIAGVFMAKFFQLKFPGLFEKFNSNGVPGIFLFSIILSFWMLPRSMDDALTHPGWEIFKFFSLAFLAGVPLRDSWKKLSAFGKNTVIVSFTVLFLALGWLYIWAPTQFCNNYLVIDQVTLGWGLITTAIALVVYLVYTFFVDPSDYV